MARMLNSFLGIAAIGLVSAGCVSQDKYNAVSLERDGLREQLSKSQSDASSAQAAAASYKSQLDQFMNGIGSKDALVGNLQQQLAAAQAQLDALNQKYAEVMNRPVGGTALPAELSNTLSQFAAQNPDLVEFDAARGIVKFKSDVTFAKGDATLTAKAKDAITRFSAILNSSEAAKYDLMVAGHTDNERVSNPATIAAGHKDNWYLSAHRAIAVGEELQKDRVSSQRLGCVGYADQRPVASNATGAGQQQNRRVEVLILPTQSRSAVAVAPASPSKKQTPVAAMNKDSGTTAVPASDLINK